MSLPGYIPGIVAESGRGDEDAGLPYNEFKVLHTLFSSFILNVANKALSE